MNVFNHDRRISNIVIPRLLQYSENRPLLGLVDLEQAAHFGNET